CGAATQPERAAAAAPASGWRSRAASWRRTAAASGPRTALAAARGSASRFLRKELAIALPRCRDQRVARWRAAEPDPVVVRREGPLELVELVDLRAELAAPRRVVSPGLGKQLLQPLDELALARDRLRRHLAEADAEEAAQAPGPVLLEVRPRVAPLELGAQPLGRAGVIQKVEVVAREHRRPVRQDIRRAGQKTLVDQRRHVDRRLRAARAELAEGHVVRSNIRDVGIGHRRHASSLPRRHFRYHRSMSADADVAAAASLLADPTRAAFLLSLSEVDGLPATELA